MMPNVKYLDKACAGLKETVGDLDNYRISWTTLQPFLKIIWIYAFTMQVQLSSQTESSLSSRF